MYLMTLIFSEAIVAREPAQVEFDEASLDQIMM